MLINIMDSTNKEVPYVAMTLDILKNKMAAKIDGGTYSLVKKFQQKVS